MSKAVKAWHFSNGYLRYGDEDIPVEAGYLYTEDRPIRLYRMGLHGSKLLIDALGYAPGLVLSETLHSGEIIHGSDKLVSSQREVLRVADVTEQVLEFADWCADRAARAAAGAAWDAARAAGAARAAAWAARDARAAEKKAQEKKLRKLVETAEWSYGDE